jgi:hypothetical protein
MWWAVAFIAVIVACALGLMWLALTIQKLKKDPGLNAMKGIPERLEYETTHLFDAKFREELKNRGRLRFESVVNENAMFLKQDLDMTTAQLNEYMKKEISTKLDGEFDAYAKNMHELQEMARNSLKEITDEVDQRRSAFAEQLEKEVAKQKDAIIGAYELNMAQVIEGYIMQALGDKFDIKGQIPFIIKQMEANKKDIIEDMKL